MIGRIKTPLAKRREEEEKREERKEKRRERGEERKERREKRREERGEERKERRAKRAKKREERRESREDIKVVAVKKLVVGFRVGPSGLPMGMHCLARPSFRRPRLLLTERAWETDRLL